MVSVADSRQASAELLSTSAEAVASVTQAAFEDPALEVDSEASIADSKVATAPRTRNQGFTTLASRDADTEISLGEAIAAVSVEFTRIDSLW